jgi:hypothetical protein
MSERAKSFLNAWISAWLETSRNEQPVPDIVAHCEADAASKDIAREELDNAAGGDLTRLLGRIQRDEKRADGGDLWR